MLKVLQHVGTPDLSAGPLWVTAGWAVAVYILLQESWDDLTWLTSVSSKEELGFLGPSCRKKNNTEGLAGDPKRAQQQPSSWVNQDTFLKSFFLIWKGKIITVVSHFRAPLISWIDSCYLSKLYKLKWVSVQLGLRKISLTGVLNGSPKRCWHLSSLQNPTGHSFQNPALACVWPCFNRRLAEVVTWGAPHMSLWWCKLLQEQCPALSAEHRSPHPSGPP